ncbi:SPFH domain-containing protein [Herbiconiux sp. CPCC 203407]|uniref:SPFH domain-containing protein n=1 Tax=Herbiconiux oxytropis TaxID=2970915 RepID=A0AA41XFZ2_9MICO|nr:flotillin family protein [Herbiconiux oxytropis]MCS5723330.1 SPFH domain-containing protein [Herbiconiux oxytropis]MCS5727509.1 SPFH domain-containing protein [Herbiconiux oxytropis]
MPPLLSFESLVTVIVVVVVVVVVLIALIVLLRGIKVAKPDEAIIVTSRQRPLKPGEAHAQTGEPSLHETENAGQRVVFGSRVFVKPIVEAHFKLSLRSRQLNVQATAQTKDAITIKVNAVAVVKVGGSESMVRAAAQRFLNQQDQIETSTEEVLSGSVRSIVGQLTVTEIITNRQALQGQVLDAVRESLDVQGLQIDTLQIKEIDDDNGYIRDLGRAEAARVKQVAEVAESVARRTSEEARIEADQAVAEQQRKLDLRNAEIQKETDKARAEASASRPLAEAISQQEVIAQQEITAGKRVGLRKQELDAEIRAVADADAYSLEKKAQADAAAAVAAANAERDRRKAVAEAVEAEGLAERNRRRSAAEATEAEGIAEKNRRIAAAEALRAEGEAEANSIRVKGAAEAEATLAKAEALEERADDLLRQQIIAELPAIVRAASEPLAAIANMTVISSDGSGAEQVGGNVSSQLATSMQIVKDLVGIDIAEIVTGRITGEAAGRGFAAASSGRASIVTPPATDPTP